MQAALEARTQASSATDRRDDSTDGSDTVQCLRIALGPDAYALRVEAVREILEVAQMTPLPLTPDFVRGVMNLRGAVVPVIDLGARLGLDVTVIGRRTCVVIVDVATGCEDGRQTLGMLVDAVHEVFDTRFDDTESVPRLGMRIEPGHVRSILRLRGQPTPELNLESILDQQQLARLIAEHAALH